MSKPVYMTRVSPDLIRSGDGPAIGAMLTAALEHKADERLNILIVAEEEVFHGLMNNWFIYGEGEPVEDHAATASSAGATGRPAR